MNVIQGNTIIQGTLTTTGGLFPQPTRAGLATDNQQLHAIPWEAWKIWNNFVAPLTATANTDDLALVGGTLGTNAPSIQAGDLKAAGATTRYARCSVMIPYNFVTGGTVQIRAHAGMKTTAADTTCVLDFELYRSDQEDGVGSDLVTTSAVDINNTTEIDADFTVDATTLLPGDIVDIRMAITCTDGATGTNVIPFVGLTALLLDVKG
jgi:hypothetical protein